MKITDNVLTCLFDYDFCFPFSVFRFNDEEVKIQISVIVAEPKVSCHYTNTQIPPDFN